MRFYRAVGMTLALTLFVHCGRMSLAAEPNKRLIPHAQDSPPNDPRDPITAARMMTVPDGFTVEVVAAEPDIVNPVAMAIDERGRFWITETLEYPRLEPGVGKDRVKICEDTDGDGRMDKFTVFMDGLNIPSGIAVEHAGVWVANSPDILFVQDTDGDGKADKQEVVVTGFGRADTHELPNSLTWGPDGWLYGLNGVFNHSHVKYPKTNPNFKDDHKGWPLTCAMFRIHPRTREFQVFCEGTSNPWGIAFNHEGEAFISACVIDHLWHLVETGCYERQGGAYPPFTWKIDSIVKHKHQKAAYCGIHYFDSDAYPEQYRGKLYMGNIHGGCINVDRVERDGATYKGFGEPDFLTANDTWFMPVVQKTGPDGCLYILDWYDRYHCYQDANRDPAGIDRLKGRLYRVRYKNSPRTPQGFDLAKESDERLIERLGAKNDFIRSTASRLLADRATPAVRRALANAAGGNGPQLSRRQALFALTASHHQTADWRMIQADLNTIPATDGPDDPVSEAWLTRFSGDNSAFRGSHSNGPAESRDPSWADWSQESLLAAPVRLQHVIALSKYPRPRPLLIEGFLFHLAQSKDDKILARVIWANLQPHLEEHSADFVRLLETKNYLQAGPVADIIPRVIDRFLGSHNLDAEPIGRLFALIRLTHPELAQKILKDIAAKVQSAELKGENLSQLKMAISPELNRIFDGPPDSPLHHQATLLAASWGDPQGLGFARRSFTISGSPSDIRLQSLSALITAKDDGVLPVVISVLTNKDQSSAFKSQVLRAIARLDDAKVADVILEQFAAMEPSLQPSAIELLTQRASWSKQLLMQIGEKKIAATAIDLTQARRIGALKDRELNELLSRHWGQLRDTRNPDRDKIVAEMKALICTTPGDDFSGEKVFKRVCATCHRIHGEGADIGPDITLNGRNDFTQLLSNVFDPSLVIGAGYRACTVVTTSGRVQSGLLIEDSPQRVVLKPAAVGRPRASSDEAEQIDENVQRYVGDLEVIPRDEIDELHLSDLSLMPEGLEKQLTPQEVVDLFAFLTLDKHPSDPAAKRLPGASAILPRRSLNPADFPSFVGEILPGFSTRESGEQGVGLLPEYLGRKNVLRTHPISRNKPCVLSRTLTLSVDKKTELILDVAHHHRGDWQLIVRGNGQQLADEMISNETCPKGWRTITVDLTRFAGKQLRLEIVNQANDWSNEFGYWGGARVVNPPQ